MTLRVGIDIDGELLIADDLHTAAFWYNFSEGDIGVDSDWKDTERHFLGCKELSPQQITDLFQAIREVLEDGA